MKKTEFISIASSMLEEMKFYCNKMTVDEFLEYSNDVLKEINEFESITKKFIINCLNLIYSDLFMVIK